MKQEPLNLFYQEPDRDRWFPYDRHPRKAIRELLYATGIRRRRPSGQRMVYQNLKRGLDRAGIPYRDNDFRYIRQHPDELMCIIGKPHLLLEHTWPNPIVFGASVFDHPVDHPDFFERYPNVKKLLVPGPWMYDMFAAHYPEERLAVWPVGIDIEEWEPKRLRTAKPDRILMYDKILWEKERRRHSVFEPVRRFLKEMNIELEILRYGDYFPEDLKAALQRSQAAIYFCEHETQGIAYQQMLASGVPLFAWDRGGYWRDPNYFPRRVRYKPVSSVPYWDARCGMKFGNPEDFRSGFETFWAQVQSGTFDPRAYVIENLTLEKCARKYAYIAEQAVSKVTSSS